MAMSRAPSCSATRHPRLAMRYSLFASAGCYSLSMDSPMIAPAVAPNTPSLVDALRGEARGAPDSGIVEVMNYGRAREGVIPLWAGEGDMPTPAFISEAATRSLAAGETFYTWQRGIPELRAALAHYHARLYGREFSPDAFFITGSGMQSIQIALAMTAGVGDEVLIPTPTWPNAAATAGVIGAKPVAGPVTLGNAGWSLDIDRLGAATGPRTRALFVVSPSNPTGWTAAPPQPCGPLAPPPP